MISEILTGIKMISVSGFCFVVVTCLNHFRIQLRPRSHSEAHPTLWLADVNFLVLQGATQNRKIISPEQPEAQGSDSSQNIPSPREKEQKFSEHSRLLST